MNKAKTESEVYVPREDSFLLRDAILKENLGGKKCLDVGTGSGIQAKAMMEKGAELVTAIDINPAAIKQAKEKLKKTKDNKTQFVGPNQAELDGLDKSFLLLSNRKYICESRKTIVLLGHQFTFFEGELFDYIKNNPKEKFDFVAFNPPYVPSEEIKWKDTDGGEKGREVIDVFIEEFPKVLAKKGVLLLLVSSLNDEKEVIKALAKKGFVSEIILEKSLFFEKLYVIRSVK